MAPSLLPPSSEPGAIEGCPDERVSAGCTVPGKRSTGAAGAGPGAGVRGGGGAISGTLRNSAGGGTDGVDAAGDAAGVDDAGGTAGEVPVPAEPVSVKGSVGAGDGD